MLTVVQIHVLKNTLRQYIAELEHYCPLYPLATIEAKYALAQLKHILDHEPLATIHLKLQEALAKRWDIIQNTDLGYCYDLISPINKFCIEVAKILAQAQTGEQRLHSAQFLMPTLSSDVGYINSPFDDDEIDFANYFLSEDNRKLICIPEVLEFGQLDSLLRCPYLIDNKPVLLTSVEVDRLFSRHPFIREVMTTINDLLNFTLYGPTAGAALSRLIHGLRLGGKKYGYDEYVAGPDAMVAIYDFNCYLRSVERNTRKRILAFGLQDRFYSDVVEFISVKNLWNQLRSPEIVKKPNELSSHYCVELVANILEEILKNNTELYTISQTHNVAPNKLARLTHKVKTTLSQLSTVLHTVQYHPSHGAAGEEKLYHSLMADIINNRYIQLTLDDLLVISQKAAQYAGDVSSEGHAMALQFYINIRRFYPTVWSILKQNLPVEYLLAEKSPRLVASSQFRMFKLISMQDKVEHGGLSVNSNGLLTVG